MTLGLPREAVTWAILVLGLGALAAAALRSEPIARFTRSRPRLTLLLLSIAAALLSVGYLHHYLRGGPRIVDATSYYLEARALAQGYFAFPIPDPSGSFRGRFLLTPPEASTLVVLFPPGYPALLALGFLLGSPLAVGPVLAAVLTFITFALARELFHRDDVALLAATLSVLCAALRYHTADTMSHAWAAILLAVSLLGALRGGRATLWAGLALGWLVATRPVTGLVCAVFVALLCARRRRSDLVLVALGAVPGLVLFGLHQHAATGSFWGSSQLRYYALADGPPGCFRYGFGAGVGCMFEHGSFVREHLPSGFGFAAALGTTGRRLWHHLGDLLNAWPLFALVLYAAIAGRRQHAVRLITLVTLALIAAYAPFYFDGNYPGGGARFYAEALPLEHGLVAWGLLQLRVARFAPGALAVAFAVHGSRAHEALRDREGGRPMYEPQVLAAQGVRHGLVFVSTDHGFNLAHLPGAHDASRNLIVARFHDDAHDFQLWQALGRPPAYRYVFDSTALASTPRLQPLVPHLDTEFAASAEWPPLAVRSGWSHPDYPGAACAAGRPGLRLRQAQIEVELLAEIDGPGRVIARWTAVNDQNTNLTVSAGGTSWSSRWTGQAGQCFETPGPAIPLSKGPFRVGLSSSTEGLVLLGLAIRPARPAEPAGKGVDN
ncbi:MAG: hypothetical protein IPI67_32065 [Myxococcales bacterium]|nr:hypothetical protein [Myxococcales bacterium]